MRVADEKTISLLQFIDLTSLNKSDTVENIAALCKKAIFQNYHVAAVCVYPEFVTTAKKMLINSEVKIATVANFPAGTQALKDVLSSIENAILQGVDELDVVFPYENYLMGQKNQSYDFIRACKNHIPKTKILKIIIEAGVLKKSNIISEVTRELCEMGVDFIKTSTGKSAIGATIDAAEIILNTIKQSPNQVGLKVSGGIRTVSEMQKYINLIENIMGRDWLTPSKFRVGASQLVDEILP